MDEDPKSKSWWTTLPGALTAAAGLIAAITALLSTLHQAGWIGSPGATGKATTTAQAPAPAPVSIAPSPPASMAPSATGKPSLPANATLIYGKLSYQILSVRSTLTTPDTLSLKLTIRLTSNDQYDAHFWDASFRLRVNGVLQAPVSNLNKVVAGNSSTDGEVEFLLPSSTERVELQMGEVGQGKPGVEIRLKAPAAGS